MSRKSHSKNSDYQHIAALNQTLKLTSERVVFVTSQTA